MRGKYFIGFVDAARRVDANTITDGMELNLIEQIDAWMQE